MRNWHVRSRPPVTASPYRDANAPLPYPEGWFILATSRDVRPGRVVVRRFMGEDVVLYRTATGRLRATRPYCPHLGAHLGHGGCVDGETLVCPFHGFAFDVDGVAVRSGPGYTGLPVRKRLSILPTEEVNGVVLVWHGNAPDRPAGWTVPDVLRGEQHHVRFVRTMVDSHPQEIVENGVDQRHLGFLHHFTSAAMEGSLTADKHLLKFELRAGRHYPPFGAITINNVFTHYGLGFLHAIPELPVPGMRLHVFIGARPTDPWQVELFIGTAVTLEPGAGRLTRLPRAVRRVLCESVAWLNLCTVANDVSADRVIWNAKRYADPPRLVDGDGPIGYYRKWARQFYPSPVTHPAAGE